MEKLKNKRIALLVADGFEEVEFTEPKKALEDQGARVDVISLNTGSIRSKRGDEWGVEYPVDYALQEVDAKEYDGLLIPGGVINPDKLRVDDGALNFVRNFYSSGKPVAAICHGPQVLISAEVVKGHKMTGYKAIRQDLINAGAHYEDVEVVADQGMVTSRSPKDIPAFNEKMIEEFGEDNHNRR